MGEWDRGDREDYHRGPGLQEWARRDAGGPDTGWDRRDGWEQRSFGETNQGGYGAQDRDRDRGGASYGQPGRGYRDDPDFRRQSAGGYGGQSERYGSQAYGSQSSDGYAQYPSYEAYGDQRYGQGYGQSGQRRSGQGQAGAFGARNERVERVVDGETDRGMFANFGHGGEHRGRGPKNYTRSDERIREDVNDRLSDDAWLDASEIEVQVTKCEVTLTGTVNSREDKRRAEDIAERVSGVKHLQNNLRVQPANTQTASSWSGASQMAAGGETAQRRT
jgi:osmotically-inducible protein OsmY